MGIVMTAIVEQEVSHKNSDGIIRTYWEDFAIFQFNKWYELQATLDDERSNRESRKQYLDEKSYHYSKLSYAACEIVEDDRADSGWCVVSAEKIIEKWDGKFGSTAQATVEYLRAMLKERPTRVFFWWC